VTLKGLCWNTSTNPITSNSYTTNGLGTDPFTAMVSGLLPNTLYYVRAYAVNNIGTAYGIEKTFQTNGLPTLTATAGVTNIIATTATSGGTITDDGRTRILSRGICWSTFSNPTIALGTKTVDTTAISLGSFLANIKGLTPGTTYYVRSYATNAVGTGYGSQVMFTTLAVMLPSLTTIHPFNVDSIKATGGGNIFDNGGMPVTVRGICWSTTSSPNPTTALGTKIDNATGGDSIYTNTLAGLLPGTKYYVRAYASNSKGTGYGQLDSLTTMAVRPGLSMITVSYISTTQVDVSAGVTNDGGATLSARGFCWNTTGNPTIADNFTINGIVTGNFTASISGLQEGIWYWVRAYATNAVGTKYGDAVKFRTHTIPTVETDPAIVFSPADASTITSTGKVTDNGDVAVTEKGMCWSTAGTPDRTGSYKKDLAVGNAISVITSGLALNTVYYIRAYATNGIGTGYGEIISFKTPYIPTVVTNPVTDITSISATGGGEVITDSGAAITARGVCWSTAPGPTILLATKTNNGTGTGIFTSNITGLSPGTTYYFRAYATNSTGTAYGNQDSFVTLATLATLTTTAASAITLTTATSGGNITNDGGATVTARGVCWSTSSTPTTGDSKTTDAAGTGVFTSSITGLIVGPIYYVRAYATNSVGTAYGNQINFAVVFACGSTLTITHTAGAVAPVTKAVNYGTVKTSLSGASKCWITQNLGSTNQAGSATDATEASAGWYWQFNRKQGYKIGPTPAWTITDIVNFSVWLPANDPCTLELGTGWRIPTSTEWTNAYTAGGMTNSTTAYNSVLKLHNAGYLPYASGIVGTLGSSGNYWSSSQYNDAMGYQVSFYSNGFGVYASRKASGFNMRCLKD